jgi:hypothetical protein
MELGRVNIQEFWHIPTGQSVQIKKIHLTTYSVQNIVTPLDIGFQYKHYLFKNYMKSFHFFYFFPSISPLYGTD